MQDHIYTGSAALSEITAYDKFHRQLRVEKRRETWKETVDRSRDMMNRRFPRLSRLINEAYDEVFAKTVLPSMRGLQYGGASVESKENRIYNCSFVALNAVYSFVELFYSLLCGTGVGFSVQRHHILCLPKIHKRDNTIPPQEHTVEDTIEGWADAFNFLLRSFFFHRFVPTFNYTKIRKRGTPLESSGGRAPGHEPLKESFDNILSILLRIEDRHMEPIEAFDVCCHISNSVTAGGSRRSAMCCLFDRFDERMLECKSFSNIADNPQRYRSNNSAVFLRGQVRKEEFVDFMKLVRDGKSGEPGIFWTNSTEIGTNPCFRGNQRILTEDGYKTFAELSGKHVRLVSEDGSIANGKVWKSGTRRTVEIRQRLRGGKTQNDLETIVCTPDHKFLTITGERVRAEGLQGKRLQPFLHTQTHEAEWVRLGFLQGDGCLTDVKNPSKRGVSFSIGSKDSEICALFGFDRNPSIDHVHYVRGYQETLVRLGFSFETLPNRTLPSTITTWSPRAQAGFLCGLYSANGTVLEKAGCVVLKTSCAALSLEVKSLLSSLGISSYRTTNQPTSVSFPKGTYACKESYDVNIATYQGMKRFSNLIGFVHKEKTERLHNVLLRKAPVVSRVIFSNECEDVYDFSIDTKEHWGVVEGVIAHNCYEISLHSNQMCNLTTVDMSRIRNQRDLNHRVRMAARLGTLQATFTNFNSMFRPIWKETTEREALLGVSMTGIACSDYASLNLAEAARVAVQENAILAQMVRINRAARVTTIKPEGTTSCIFGTSSGIHAAHGKFYIRRIRLEKPSPLYNHLCERIPALVEESREYGRKDREFIVALPQVLPHARIVRTDETAISLLERVRYFHEHWISPGHIDGVNKHNVSCTIYVRDEEWGSVTQWLWDNRESYNAVALFPYDGGVYEQMPFEDIDERTFLQMMSELRPLDLHTIREEEDTTRMEETVACAGGACDL